MEYHYISLDLSFLSRKMNEVRLSMFTNSAINFLIVSHHLETPMWAPRAGNSALWWWLPHITAINFNDRFQFSSVACVWLCNPMDCSTPGFPVHHQLPELAQTHVHWVSDAIQPYHPLSSPSLPAFNLAHSSESVLCIRWPKYWNFSFSISPSNEYSGLISFRMGWFDLLAVQGTLKEFSPIPQFKSINSSVLSFLYGLTRTSYMTTGKTHTFD